MPTAHTDLPAALGRIRFTAEYDLPLVLQQAARVPNLEMLLERCRDYLGDGHATAPIAAALVSDINTALAG